MAWFILVSAAHAGIQVVPKRIILSGDKPEGRLTVQNSGTEIAIFEILVAFFRMEADGSLKEVEQPKGPERSVIPYLEWSPRQVTLAAGSRQVINVSARIPESLPHGDYRAHIGVAPVSNKPGLSAVFRIFIPVIYRHGEVHTQVTLDQLRLDSGSDGQPGFAVEMALDGSGFINGSIYTDFTGADGVTQQVGVVHNVWSYLNHRTVRYTFNQLGDTRLDNGVLSLRFQALPEFGNQETSIETRIQ